MRLWPKRRAEAPPAAPTTHEEIPLVRTPETQRALEAARAAAIELYEARRLRAKIDHTADRMDAETSKNGFVPLIRQAFGSGS